MMEGITLAIVLVVLSFLFLLIYDRWITTRLWRTLLWWKVPRMDVRSEELAWERVADRVLDEIDTLYLGWVITASTRQTMLKKLQHFPGLGVEFTLRNYQPLLKEAIRGRLGKHTTPRFPDPGPYCYAYISSSIDDRSKSTVVLLKMRTGKWRTKVP